MVDLVGEYVRSSDKPFWEIYGEETILDKSEIAHIISDIFPVPYKTASEAISDAHNWSNEVWNTPDWYETSNWFTFDEEDSHLMFKEYDAKKEYYYKFWNYPEFEDMVKGTISETYLRAILYYLVASTKGLNYYPDSIRVPIIAYINKRIRKNINKLGQKLIKEAEKMPLILQNRLISSLALSIGFR